MSFQAATPKSSPSEVRRSTSNAIWSSPLSPWLRSTQSAAAQRWIGLSTTVRAAKDYGLRCTLVEDACATRDLPTPDGIISAAQVQKTEMAIMNDNFATLTLTKNLI